MVQVFIIFDRTLAAGVDFAASATALLALDLWCML